MRDSAIASLHTITAITVKRVIASINLNGVTQFDGIVRYGKEQAMSRYIDADALPRHGQRGGLVHWKDIEDAPSIDIVRCRECKYDGTWKCPWRNTQVPRYPSANDFCSYGERSSE